MGSRRRAGQRSRPEALRFPVTTTATCPPSSSPQGAAASTPAKPSSRWRSTSTQRARAAVELALSGVRERRRALQLGAVEPCGQDRFGTPRATLRGERLRGLDQRGRCGTGPGAVACGALRGAPARGALAAPAARVVGDRAPVVRRVSQRQAPVPQARCLPRTPGGVLLAATLGIVARALKFRRYGSPCSERWRPLATSVLAAYPRRHGPRGCVGMRAG